MFGDLSGRKPAVPQDQISVIANGSQRHLDLRTAWWNIVADCIVLPAEAEDQSLVWLQFEILAEHDRAAFAHGHPEHPARERLDLGSGPPPLA